MEFEVPRCARAVYGCGRWTLAEAFPNGGGAVGRVSPHCCSWRYAVVVRFNAVFFTPYPSPMPRYRVYMIELDRAVMHIRAFRERNPDARADKPCVYVGST